jgi:Cu(I)/Ag(I) efflux system protein CusF
LRDNTRAAIAGKFFVVALCSALVVLAASCQQRRAVTNNKPDALPTPAKTDSPPQTAEVKTYHGAGVVTKIVLENPYDKTLSSVEINHGDIEGLMPAMRMEFFVKEKSLLKGLKVGDKVDFTLEAKDSSEIVSEISKSK